MSLNVLPLIYDEKYISNMGTEYVCTGYMFDMSNAPAPSLGSQVASFDLVGVQDENYNIPGSPGSTTPSAPGAPLTTGGAMGGGSY